MEGEEGPSIATKNVHQQLCQLAVSVREVPCMSASADITCSILKIFNAVAEHSMAEHSVAEHSMAEHSRD